MVVEHHAGRSYPHETRSWWWNTVQNDLTYSANPGIADAYRFNVLHAA